MYVYVQTIIDGMEPLDREILSLRHYEELTNHEAAVDGLPIGQRRISSVLGF